MTIHDQNAWQPSQWSLSTAHGKYTILSAPWDFAVQRAYANDEGDWHSVWVGGEDDSHSYPHGSLDAAQRAVAADIARLDATARSAAEVLAIDRRADVGEQLEAQRCDEVIL